VAGWFDLTPRRRQLILAGFATLGLTGGAVVWFYGTVRDWQNRAGAAGAQPGAADPVQQDQQNRLIVQLPARVQELDALERALDKGQEFVRSVERTYPRLTPSDEETRQKLDRAIDDVVASLRRHQTRLDVLLGSEALAADRTRVSALRTRCSALITRLTQIRTNKGPGAPDKE
jgi:hypothetical protein